jgi:hypothetical protein
VLGNKVQARKILDEIQIGIGIGIGNNVNTYWEAISWMDLELAVSEFLIYFNETHDSQQLDEIAAYSLVINPKFYLHPKMQEAIIRQGKWQHYLAKYYDEYRP